MPRRASGRMIEQQSADHGAGQAAEPANDHHGEDVDRLAELELVWADEIGRVGEQRAGDSGEETTGPESHYLQLDDVEPHSARALIVFPHGAQRVAEVGMGQPRQHPEGDRRHRRDHQYCCIGVAAASPANRSAECCGCPSARG